MSDTYALLRQHLDRVLAIIIICTLYVVAQLPTTDSDQRKHLAKTFKFTSLPLPTLNNFPKKTIRDVSPSLEHISAWISSVGAAVSLNDLDNDGLANDLCYVDTRIDQVIIAPAPGTGNRYTATPLNPAPLPFDATTMAPMGCLPGDYNEDGVLDLLVYYWGRTPIIFVRNATTSGYQPQELVNTGERWFTNTATTADLDGDGHTDLIIANYFQDGAHILDKHATEDDSMQHSMSRAYNGGETHFFLNMVNTEQTRQLKEMHNIIPDIANTAWTLAIGAADLDGDLLPEIYFANDFGPDRLFHNRSTPGKLNFALLEGERTFTTPASKVLGQDSFKGMGVDFADLNGDGWQDMFVSNIAAEYALEESHFVFVSTGKTELMQQGIAPYQDLSEPLGMSRSNWSWDTKMADFNNDGVVEAIQATGFVKGKTERWPELQELALGNDENLRHPSAWPKFKAGDALSGSAHNPFYVRNKQGRYIDIAAELGMDQTFISRGFAVADIDGDGDLDFAVANQWEPSYLLLNDCPDCSSFLGLHLRFAIQPTTKLSIAAGHHTEPSRPAIGATVKVTLADGRTLVSEVDGGNGHSGRRSHDLHFGLGHLPKQQKLKVTLRWRDSSGALHKQRIKLKQGWHTILLTNPV
ncbi:MAG: enediyne biosynthesis protein E4 [Methyloprofundus sp.]|nr:MAG: enediyne biosynthesis protein E4 [Methyloprofundus sp.]